MQRFYSKLTVFILAMIFMVSIGWSSAFSYRYHDNNGVMHIGYSIPPEFVANGYEVLNEKGRVIDVILPKKVRDEQTAKMLAEAEAHRDREVQRVKDEALLRYYSTPEDVVRVRDRKLSEFDSFVAIQEGNILANQRKMIKLQRQAADIERSGRKVPTDIINTLATLEDKIKESEELIENKNSEKIEVNNAFQADIERLEQLLGLRN